MIATARRSPLGAAAPVTAVVGAAVDDALMRLDSKLDGRMPIAEGSDAGAEILDWARGLGLKQVVTPYVPVGPTAEALQEVSETLAAEGIVLIPVLRRWDHLAWPHATRGFFPFRERIPTILGALQSQ